MDPIFCDGLGPPAPGADLHEIGFGKHDVHGFGAVVAARGLVVGESAEAVDAAVVGGEGGVRLEGEVEGGVEGGSEDEALEYELEYLQEKLRDHHRGLT